MTDEARGCFTQGRELYRRGKYSLALGHFSKAIELDKEKSAYYFWRGKTFLMLSRPTLALADFNQGMRLTPNSMLYCERALCYLTLNEPEKAHADLEAVPEKERTSAKYYATLSRYAFYMRETERAYACILQAIQADPQQIKWLLQLCEFHIRQNEFDKAEEKINEAQKRDPHNPFVYEQKCTWMMAKGEYRQALDFLDKLIPVSQEWAAFYKAKVLCHLKLSEYESARLTAEQAVSAAPEDTEAYNLRTQCYFYCGEMERTLTELAYLIRANPQHSGLLQFFWHFFMQKKAYEYALYCVNHLITWFPKKAEYYYLRSQTYACMKQFEVALVDIQQAITHDNAQSYYYLMRACYHRDSQNHMEALKDFSIMIELTPPTDPMCASYYEERAGIYYALNLYQEALQDFERSIQQQPTKIALYLCQINCYIKLNQIGIALQKCQELLKIDAQCETAYLLYVDLLMKTGGFTEALALAPTLLAFTLPQAAKDKLLFDMAWCCISTHEYEQALSYLNAISQAAQQVEYYGLYARCLSNLGKSKAAIPYWDQCIIHQPIGLHYVNRGICYLNSNQLEQAQQDFEQAIHCTPTLALAHFWMGMTYVELDKKKQTIRSMREVIRLESATRTELYLLPLAYLWRGRAYYYTMFGEKALQDWQNALALNPNVMNPYPQIKADYESLLKLKTQLNKNLKPHDALE